MKIVLLLFLVFVSLFGEGKIPELPYSFKENYLNSISIKTYEESDSKHYFDSAIYIHFLMKEDEDKFIRMNIPLEDFIKKDFSISILKNHKNEIEKHLKKIKSVKDKEEILEIKDIIEYFSSDSGDNIILNELVVTENNLFMQKNEYKDFFKNILYYKLSKEIENLSNSKSYKYKIVSIIIQNHEDYANKLYEKEELKINSKIEDLLINKRYETFFKYIIFIIILIGMFLLCLLVIKRRFKQNIFNLQTPFKIVFFIIGINILIAILSIVLVFIYILDYNKYDLIPTLTGMISLLPFMIIIYKFDFSILLNILFLRYKFKELKYLITFNENTDKTFLITELDFKQVYLNEIINSEIKKEEKVLVIPIEEFLKKEIVFVLNKQVSKDGKWIIDKIDEDSETNKKNAKNNFLCYFKNFLWFSR